MDRAELDVLLRGELDQLVAALVGLDQQQWQAPSLCRGWTVRDVVAHVLMPYDVSVPRFMVLMARAGFRFDVAADRWARGDKRSGKALLDRLRDVPARRFRVPGAPPEAALSHLSWRTRRTSTARSALLTPWLLPWRASSWINS